VTSPRPVVLIGFMGAGKSTVGRLVAGRLDRPFVDADRVIEAVADTTIPDLFARDGEAAFRAREARIVSDLVANSTAQVIAVGGGAVREPTVRLLARRAHVIWLDVSADEAWRRISGDATHRPLARDHDQFVTLYQTRRSAYADACDAYVDADAPPDRVAEHALQAAIIRPGALDRLAEQVGSRRALVVADREIATRLPARLPDPILISGGEAAKTVDSAASLWRSMADADLERRDVLIAVGGGTVTDVAGFAAATFRRGVAWIAAPTTLVGQIDAAIGGKTAINVAAKNDVGAFHQPEAVITDPTLLETLARREWAAGLAEAIKTMLLEGGALAPLVDGLEPGIAALAERTELVRRCAAYKTRVVVEDPTEQGRRAVLNLGHTIGHGVEAAAGYQRFLHGEAVAVGLCAALSLSEQLVGLDPAVRAHTETLLTRHGLPTRADGLDPRAVMNAIRGDKKRSKGRPRMVLLAAVGDPRIGIDPGDELLADAVRDATASV
jgi:shikimate kinase / 3-dehydroquinate synthase